MVISELGDLCNTLISTHRDFALTTISNYTESGHGKGAPDGIGGIIKQSADKAVAEGNDIPDVDALFTVLRERCTGVFVKTVSESDITVIEKSLPQSINPLVSTMKSASNFMVHSKTFQVLMQDHFPALNANQVINVFIITLKVNGWVAVRFEYEWFPGK
ncbi:hypothetical protein AVEN_86257-1 [Araneus ventricosus]|uniref:Uncharacterized protein n=1 Tax=Araneus ventricosus TaxID=182803 RepID=A0A4Y2RPK6_ARAVE|nr:hypothetical protein AVEN_86257-1 [Araneus ventricosus]